MKSYPTAYSFETNGTFMIFEDNDDTLNWPNIYDQNRCAFSAPYYLDLLIKFINVIKSNVAENFKIRAVILFRIQNVKNGFYWNFISQKISGVLARISNWLISNS